MKINQIKVTMDDEWFDVDRPQYAVHATKCTPYRDDDNYIAYEDEMDVLYADSLEELYEQMAKMVVNHMLYGEKYAETTYTKAGQYTVEFSEIYVVVGNYNEAMLKATKVYQEIGLVREKKRIEDEKRKEEERKRIEECQKKEQEERDKREFARLCQKFGVNNKP